MTRQTVEALIATNLATAGGSAPKIRADKHREVATALLDYAEENGGSSAGAVPFSSAIPFSKDHAVMNKLLTGAVAFTVDTTDQVTGGGTVVRIVADGINVPTFHADFTKSGSSQSWDNTQGKVHQVIFYWNGFEHLYSLSRLDKIVTIPDTTAPAFSAAAINMGNADKIVLTYNELLKTSVVPATSDYAVSGGKTVTGVAISGATVTLTVNSAYSAGNVVTVSYTAGTNKLQDTAGNFAANLTNAAVTNNLVAATLIEDQTFDWPIVTTGTGYSWALGGGITIPTNGKLASSGMAYINFGTTSLINIGAGGETLQITVDITSITSGSFSIAFGSPSGTENVHTFTTPGIKTFSIDTTTGTTGLYFLAGEGSGLPSGGVYDVNRITIQKL